MMRSGVFVFAMLVAAALPAGVRGQERAQPAPGREAIGPAEVQRLFDAYMLLRAEESLGLRGPQYGEFAARLKALQETRRRLQRERMRILQDLRRLSATEPIDEAAVRERLEALRAHDLQAAPELAKAYDRLDEILDLRQRARLRLLEEALERRKLELLLRARQNRPPPAR
ncbi:MAG TPA: hypothetical protein VNI83_07135 [Vicinamibacterales bacterium]|nr:hypothetical protein [Vicinamibacterales bacterium]